MSPRAATWVLIGVVAWGLAACGGSTAEPEQPSGPEPEGATDSVEPTGAPIATEQPASSSPSAAGAPAPGVSGPIGAGETTATDATNPEPVPAQPPRPSGKRAPCVLGQDQSCNGDPSVSALWGRCTAAGTCECKLGFELAPTGYCQPRP